MMHYAIKILVSAAIIVAVSEVSKRSALIGGLVASLPLVSFLGILWLYADTKDSGKVADLSTSIFWLVLPSLAFFLVLPALLKIRVNFYASFTLATGIMLACYGMMLLVLKKVASHG